MPTRRSKCTQMPQSPAQSGASERCSSGAARFCTGPVQLLRLMGKCWGFCAKRKLIRRYFISHDKEGPGAARGWKRQPLISRAEPFTSNNDVPPVLDNEIPQDANLLKLCCVNLAQKLHADNDKTYSRKSSQGAQVKRKVMVVSSTRILALCLVNSGH